MQNPLGPLAGSDDFGLVPGAHPANWRTGVLVAANGHGGAAIGVRATVAENAYSGGMVAAFGGDFYGRVHYSFVLADLGNVVGDQTLVLSVWNAYLRAERLLGITAENATGVTLNGGPVLPAPFAALGEVTYSVTVSTNGPANLAAAFSFDWQTADAVVRVVGVRIIPWSFRPDWSSGIVERMEWRTDVLQAYNAKEQRRALRLAPRKGYEFECFMTDRERRYAEANLWGWGARVWALPVWPDGEELPSPLPIGSLTIPANTAGRDYAVGGLCVLLGDALTVETLEVAAVNPASITLVRPTERAWPQGTLVYPARTARLGQVPTLQRWTGDASGMRAVFNLVDPVDFAPDVGATLYRSLPVLTRRPNWAGPLEVELTRKLAELDNLTGAQVFDDEAGMPLALQRMRWMLTSKAEQAEFRALAYALRGRQGAAWVPTWTNDLRVVALIDLAATAIDVEFTAYARQVAAGTGRRDIRMELTDGTVYYRRVLSASQISDDTERLVIDAPTGRTIAPAEVLGISFMALCRLESDAVEMAYWTGDTADVATLWRAYQHEL